MLQTQTVVPELMELLKKMMSEKPFEIDGIRMVSKKDIAVMKWNAIAGKGSKKDFIDLFYLLNEFSLEEILSFYEKNIKRVQFLWFKKA